MSLLEHSDHGSPIKLLVFLEEGSCLKRSSSVKGKYTIELLVGQSCIITFLFLKRNFEPEMLRLFLVLKFFRPKVNASLWTFLPPKI